MSLENPIKSHEVLRFFCLIIQCIPQSTLIYNHLNPMPNPMVCVRMVRAKYSKSMDQPGIATDPAHIQLNREKFIFPVPVRASEFGLARQVWPFRPAPVQLFSTFMQNLVLTHHGVPIASRDGVRKIPTAIGSVPSLSGHGFAYQWHSLPKSPAAQDQKSSR